MCARNPLFLGGTKFLQRIVYKYTCEHSNGCFFNKYRILASKIMLALLEMYVAQILVGLNCYLLSPSQ